MVVRSLSYVKTYKFVNRVSDYLAHLQAGLMAGLQQLSAEDRGNGADKTHLEFRTLPVTEDIAGKEEIEPAFREAMKSTKTPTVIEFEIDPEDLVYPMIQPGGTLEDMILDC